MKRILVAVDGSEPALHAIRFAAGLALQVGGALTLVHVIEPYPLLPAELPIPYQELHAAQAKQGESLLAEARQKVAKGLPVETQLLNGGVADAVAELAETGGFELVAVGSRGRNAITRVLLGSVADRLVHVCKVPVVVVR